MEKFVVLFFCGIVAYIVFMWLFDLLFDRPHKLNQEEEDRLTKSYGEDN